MGMFGCNAQNVNYTYESETLIIEQLSENTFRHVSYLKSEKFGRVACNGMVVTDSGEALIFDTPANKADSKELITWIENSLKCKPKGIIVTHFHIDCLGGLSEFHKAHIPSYANNKTIELAKSTAVTLPQIGFGNYFVTKVGKKKVLNEFLGEGHTKDNIISYFPGDKVLFGGCLIKEKGAGKGNLEDANPDDWSATVEAVKTKYRDAEIIIPGHGKPGSQDLLNYTIQLFKRQ
jgi:metallo-beta-lactamase class B